MRDKKGPSHPCQDGAAEHGANAPRHSLVAVTRRATLYLSAPMLAAPDHGRNVAQDRAQFPAKSRGTWCNLGAMVQIWLPDSRGISDG
jgi:hypothetical protein